MDVKYFARAVKHIYPNSQYVIYGDTLDGLQFIDPLDLEITQSEIDEAIEQVKANEIAEAEAKAQAKAALLERLGITADEAKLLLS
jgi:hypothetical protein